MMVPGGAVGRPGEILKQFWNHRVITKVMQGAPTSPLTQSPLWVTSYIRVLSCHRSQASSGAL